MSTTITGVHFVYRPAHAPERSQALAEVALIQRERQVQITGVEYSDGRFDPFDDEPKPPPSDFSLTLHYVADTNQWGTTVRNANGWCDATLTSVGDAIAQLFSDLLIAGGGDWCAVNRRTGDVV